MFKWATSPGIEVISGAPRVFLDLCEAGETCGKHLVAGLIVS